jgi:hypothetical protein
MLVLRRFIVTPAVAAHRRENGTIHITCECGKDNAWRFPIVQL